MAHTYALGKARTSSAANPTTASYTVAAGDTVVCLMIKAVGATNRAGGAPTLTGGPSSYTLTQANSTQKAAASPEASAEMWYVLNPAPGTYTLTIPNTGAITLFYTVAIGRAAAGGKSAFGAANGSNNTSVDPTPGAVNCEPGSIVFAITAGGWTTWAPSAQAGTIIANTDDGADGGGEQYALRSTSGSFTLNWTFATSDDWGAVVAAFYEVAPSGRGQTGLLPPHFRRARSRRARRAGGAATEPAAGTDVKPATVAGGMFLCGLEETPWSGWTLSNLVTCGPRLLLAGCVVNDCSSLTGWTAVSGTAPTVEFGRLKFAAAGVHQAPSAMDVSGDFDVRVDFDVCTSPYDSGGSGRAVVFKVAFSGGNSISVCLSNQYELRHGTTTDATLALDDRFGTFRLVRRGNAFVAQIWDWRRECWGTIGTTTQAYSAAGQVQLGTEVVTGSVKTYYDNLYEGAPSARSGYASSPILDTSAGFRGLGWFLRDQSSDVVTVEYRTGSTDAACFAAPWQAAYNWQPVAPTAANRYVQVRVSIAAPTTASYDRFRDGDNVDLVAHQPDVGNRWNSDAGSIQCYQGYAQGGGAADPTLYYVDAGSGDVTVKTTVTLSGATDEAGFVIRRQDASNRWMVTGYAGDGKIYLYKTAAGVETNPASFTAGVADGVAFDLAVVADGPNFTFYVNGVSVGTYTDSAFQNATGMGLRCRNGSTRFGDFVVAPLRSSVSPTVQFGPLLVDGPLDQASCILLAKRCYAQMARHTDANYRMNINEAVSTGATTTAKWNRSGVGLGLWVAAGLGDTLSFESTNYTLSSNFVGSVNTLYSDMSAGNQLLIESGNWTLKAIYDARTTLVPLFSSGNKSTITTKTDSSLNSGAATNQISYSCSSMAWLTLLAAYDSGSWQSYTDTNISDQVTTIEGRLIGDGQYNDVLTGTTYTSIDSYSTFIAESFAYVLYYRPSYTGASTLRTRLKQYFRNMKQITDADGTAWPVGRSLHGALWTEVVGSFFQSTLALSGSWVVAREALGRAIKNVFRYSYYHGFDHVARASSRNGTAASIENENISQSEITASFAGTCAMCASNPSLFSAASVPFATDETAWAWDGACCAYAVGAGGGTNADPPAVRTFGNSYPDPGLIGAVQGSYAPGVYSTRFARNHGSNVGGWNPLSGVHVYAQSTVAQYGVFDANVSRKLAHLGRGALMWRRGNPVDYNTSPPTNRASYANTEAHVCFRNRCLVFAKIEKGAATLTGVGVPTPPVTLLARNLSSVTGTSPRYVYGYRTNDAQDGVLAHFLKELEGGYTANETGLLYATTSLLQNCGNVLGYGGAGSKISRDYATSGTFYSAFELALSHGGLTPSAETGWSASYSRSTDVVTLDCDAAGSSAKLYLGLVSQTLSGQAVGSYAISGGTVYAFLGKASAADWWGGSDLTLVTYSGTNQGALSVAGNLAIDKTSSTNTRVYVKSTGNATLYAGALPVGFSNVYAIDWDGQPVDVTGSCTLTPGTSVVIPQSVIAAYSFGLSTFDVQANPISKQYVILQAVKRASYY